MVFVKKISADRPEDHPMFTNLGKRNRKGLVGIEVEVEGRHISQNPPEPWVFHIDNSLRGPEHGEYVLDGPVSFEDVSKVLDILWASFKTNKTLLNVSDRTSVHIHLNILPFFMNRLTSLMALWMMSEDVLTHWCGDSRVGNHFCLRAKDSNAIVTRIRKFVATDGGYTPPEGTKYSGMNLYAIPRYGSLEFRTLSGCTDPEIIKTWVAILKRLYDASDNYADPRTLCEQFSLDGPINFFNNIFGDLSGVIRKDIPFDEDQLRDSLYEGIRFAQEICYARDWNDFNPVKKSSDPFGRGAKKKTTTNEAPWGANVEWADPFPMPTTRETRINRMPNFEREMTIAGARAQLDRMAQERPVRTVTIRGGERIRIQDQEFQVIREEEHVRLRTGPDPLDFIDVEQEGGDEI